ncbi:hypothetical protein BHE74_00044403 [Ensete ventricosum]|nr:hypothetical protein BHE74_00044403 [Ensete ventricosum]
MLVDTRRRLTSLAGLPAAPPAGFVPGSHGDVWWVPPLGWVPGVAADGPPHVSCPGPTETSGASRYRGGTRRPLSARASCLSPTRLRACCAALSVDGKGVDVIYLLHLIVFIPQVASPARHRL